MIVIPKKECTKKEMAELIDKLEKSGCKAHVTIGTSQTIIGLVGDTSKIDIDQINSLPFVEDVKRIQEPYKNANRKFHPDDTIIDLGTGKIGGGNFVYMAGPCSVETEDQIIGIAEAVKKAGAQVLRGGAFKPRTSPYSFQGLGAEGIKLLLKAKKATGLPIVSEIMDISQLKYFDDVDILQVGARNMQNFELLKELGKQNKPILLKRGLSSTIQELMMSAEYIMAGGNEKVILCERGIRTFETTTRNTLDLACIPVIKSLSHLPIIIDPSHSTGYARYVKPMSYAAVAAGADGLIIEVHNNPPAALCDGQQSITPSEFNELVKNCNNILPFGYRE